MVGDHLLQLLRRAVGLLRLHERDHARHDDHEHQHQKRGPAGLLGDDHVRHQRDAGHGQQHDVERVDDGLPDALEQAVLAAGVDDVFAVFLQALAGLHLVEALRAGLEPLEYLPVRQPAEPHQPLLAPGLLRRFHARLTPFRMSSCPARRFIP